jgi:hypothetical protein
MTHDDYLEAAAASLGPRVIDASDAFGSWRLKLILNDNRKPRALVANVITAFREAPEWKVCCVFPCSRVRRTCFCRRRGSATKLSARAASRDCGPIWTTSGQRSGCSAKAFTPRMPSRQSSANGSQAQSLPPCPPIPR